MPKAKDIVDARDSMLAGVVPILARFPENFSSYGSYRPKVDVSLGHGTAIHLDGVDDEHKAVQDDFMVSLLRSLSGH